MPITSPIPAALVSGPFTVRQAAAAGLTRKVLMGRRFRQLFRGVWVLADHVMTHQDWIVAATLAMPPDAHPSHLTRLQGLGLEFGPQRPLHFVVARDLHLAVPGIFLHRTEVLPPTDDDGITPAAAFIGCCATERVIDLIGIGDWLLRGGHMTTVELRELAVAQDWRPGSREALGVVACLDERSRSLKESEMRAVFAFAGLPKPAVNPPLFDDPSTPWSDLYWEEWRLAAEFEGGHHFTDPEQIKRDMARYAWMRSQAIEYVQVVNETLAQPRALVRHVHDKLVERGYRGPAPEFGARWTSLFHQPRTGDFVRTPETGR